MDTVRVRELRGGMVEVDARGYELARRIVNSFGLLVAVEAEGHGFGFVAHLPNGDVVVMTDGDGGYPTGEAFHAALLDADGDVVYEVTVF